MSLHSQQVVSALLSQNAQFPHTVFYDFHITFFLNTSCWLSISPGLPCLFWRAYFTPEPQTTGQLPQRRWKSIMERTDWPWNIYGSLVLWLYEFWQRRHITVTLPPNKRPDVLLSVVAWRGETKCMFFLRALLLPPLPSLCIKDVSGYFRIDRHPFQHVVFSWLLLFFHSFPLFFLHCYFSSNLFAAKCARPLSSRCLLFPLNIPSHFLHLVISAPHS